MATNKRRRNRGVRVRLRRARGGLTPKHILRNPLYLQCLIGEELVTSREASHTEYDTVSAGQFSQPAAGKHAPILDELSFDHLTLTWDAKWLVNPGTRPARIRKEIDRIIAARCPIHVMITVTPNANRVEVSGLFTIRRRERRLRHGETDTRYYTLELKRYRDPRLRRRGRRRNKLPARHRLTSKDTLRSLSKRYYGTASLWRFIARKNGIKKWGGATPLVKLKRYKAGDRITIPNPFEGTALLTTPNLSAAEAFGEWGDAE